MSESRCTKCGAIFDDDIHDGSCLDCTGPLLRNVKHTDGPWTVRPMDTPIVGIDATDKQGRPVYICSARKRDARLIAAAPLMLAALLRAVNDPDEDGALEQAEAAIAAATGDDS